MAYTHSNTNKKEMVLMGLSKVEERIRKAWTCESGNSSTFLRELSLKFQKLGRASNFDDYPKDFSCKIFHTISKQLPELLKITRFLLERFHLMWALKSIKNIADKCIMSRILFSDFSSNLFIIRKGITGGQAYEKMNEVWMKGSNHLYTTVEKAYKHCELPCFWAE